MITLTTQQKDELRKIGISAVYLFGSHAQGTASAGSDLDLAVLFSVSARVKPGANTLPLYEKLYDTFSDSLPGDRDTPMDIVFLQSGVSLELQANVVRNGKLLLDDEPLKRGQYEEQVMIRAADFSPILRMMDNAILERI